MPTQKTRVFSKIEWYARSLKYMYLRHSGSLKKKFRRQLGWQTNTLARAVMSSHRPSHELSLTYTKLTNISASNNVWSTLLVTRTQWMALNVFPLIESSFSIVWRAHRTSHLTNSHSSFLAVNCRQNPEVATKDFSWHVYLMTQHSSLLLYRYITYQSRISGSETQKILQNSWDVFLFGY